jgi:hypothetical protein
MDITVTEALFPAAITDAVRSEVFRAWGDKCAYCRVRDAEHCDHIYPRSKGGQDALENYAASCETCNLMKSDMILGEGILHIVQRKAAQKAPGIRTRLDHTTSSKKDPAPYIEELIASAVLLELTQERGPQDEASIDALRNAMRAQILQKFGRATITKIKAETSRLRSEIRKVERRRANQPLCEDLISLRIAGGDDHDTAREEVQQIYANASQTNLRSAIARQKRLNAPRPLETVTVRVPRPLRSDILSSIAFLKDHHKDARTTLHFSAKDHPNLYQAAVSQGPTSFEVSWKFPNGGALLLYAYDLNDQGFKVDVSSAAWFFLKIAIDLDADELTFPSHIDGNVLPAPEDCLPRIKEGVS